MNIHVVRTALIALAAVAPCEAVAGGPPTQTAGGEVAIDALITVNGEPITGADIDAMIMDRHRSIDMTETGEQLLLRLLEKAVNDELILQDAYGMGLHEEADLLEPVERKRLDRAIALWVGETLAEPPPPTQAAIDAHFREQYRRIQVRQFSLRSREEIERIRTELQAGADWDAMARVMSLDTRSIHGGLHNDKYWLDLEPALQTVAQRLATGELSEPFRYRESWSLLRVETRTPADAEELPALEALISEVLTEAARKDRWERFVAELSERTPVIVDFAVLESLRADAGQVYMGSFFNESSRPALTVDERFVVTESELRRAAGKLAMEMGTSSFEEILDRALDQETRRLLLRHGAVVAEYAERPEVMQAYAKDLREALINAYLNETVVQRIRFDRAEYDRVYEENKEEFRGPDNVQLSFLFLDTAEQAEQVAHRLAQGASFDFVRKEIMGAGHSTEQSKWAALEMFSDGIIDAVDQMTVGSTSPALPFRDRWMIFRLDGRREGDIAPIEQVDTEIRQVLFQRQFQELLDRTLAVLKSNSEIIRHEDRIRRYFSAES